MVIEHWDTYEHELSMLGHGHPVWNADAFQEFQEVQIGDIGYACGGKLWRAFNVFYGDTSGRNSFPHYAQSRWESWRALPEDGKCFHSVNPQKLTFIYGTTKTKAWSTMAYEEIGWERV
ncbi:hypothetical protein EWM64_g6302, partial [Hericium alpestre]